MNCSEFPRDVNRGTIGDHVEPPAEVDLVVRPLLLGLRALSGQPGSSACLPRCPGLAELSARRCRRAAAGERSGGYSDGQPGPGTGVQAGKGPGQPDDTWAAMASEPGRPGKQAYDRWLLLGEMRNELLTLRQVQQYGRDSFGDPRTTCRSMASSPVSGMRAGCGYWAARRLSAPGTGWPA